MGQHLTIELWKFEISDNDHSESINSHRWNASFSFIFSFYDDLQSWQAKTNPASQGNINFLVNEYYYCKGESHSLRISVTVCRRWFAKKVFFFPRNNF